MERVSKHRSPWELEQGITGSGYMAVAGPPTAGTGAGVLAQVGGGGRLPLRRREREPW